MPTWCDLDERELQRRIEDLYLGYQGKSVRTRFPDENDPLRSGESDLGLRIFQAGDYKYHAKDLASGIVCSDQNWGKAIGDLRSKVC